MRKAVKVGIVETELDCKDDDQGLNAEIWKLDKIIKLGKISPKP
jgi:hypothetical protein